MGGGDKTAMDVGGVSLRERVIASVSDAVSIVVVGPAVERPVDAAAVRWVSEDPPDGGPLAALAAALKFVEAPVVVVLAGDLPFAAGLPPVLLAALADAPAVDAVVPRDSQGNDQPLAAAYRTDALTRTLASIGTAHGRAMRALLDHLCVHAVPADELPPGTLDDVDTASDLDAARRRASSTSLEPTPTPTLKGGSHA